MNTVTRLKRRLLISLFFIPVVHINAYATELPIVPNVQLVGNQLTWEALDGATGYNIYNNTAYLTTITNSLDFTVSEAGTYSVLGFNDEGDFTPLRGSLVLEFTDGVNNRQLVSELAENFFYITRRCSDVSAGESCIAECPDSAVSTNPNRTTLIRGATGGACSSSDNLPVNAKITPNNYTCTVSNFTSTVTTQVVCSTE